MLSFAFRSSHGIQKHPVLPLCRAYLNSNGLRCGRPAAALLARGFATTQTRLAAKKAPTKGKANARARAKAKAALEASSSDTTSSNTTSSEPTRSSETTSPKAKKVKKKGITKEKKPKVVEKVTRQRNRAEKYRSTPPTTREEIHLLWQSSMDIVGNMKRIGPEKLTDNQIALMAGTLDVIKSVLQSKARILVQAGDKAHSSADADVEGKSETKESSSKQELINIIRGGNHPSFIRHIRGERNIPSPPAPSTMPHQPMIPASPTAERPRPGDPETTIPAWHGKHKASVKVLPGRGKLNPIPVPTPPVPLIQYGLDRVLFNEGVYVLQDPRTGVFNFDPYLAKIMPVTEFDFDALKEYITSSKDEILLGVTKDRRKKYTGSTSSMTATLAHFHFLLSNWRKINLARISREYEPEMQNFVSVLRAPAATFLNYNDGVYAIDADKEWDDETILSMLGKSMEMLLTAPREEYEKYRRDVSHKLTEEERNKPESYHYTEFGDFVMRSQLDAYDPRLPGTGVYDLKTRAVVSIRMDAVNYKKGKSYEIIKRTGEWESFEREYHDMIRGAFLKYSLQVRMGRMDGIFVAYHNTERIFGFQYVPLEEMDQSIHGTLRKSLGDQEFRSSLKLWNIMLNQAIEKFPGQSLRVHVETRTSQKAPFMYFFAEPVTTAEIKSIQVRDQATVDKFRETVLGITPPGQKANADDLSAEDPEPTNEEDDAQATSEKETASEEDLNEHTTTEEEMPDAEREANEEVWENMMTVVEETMENDVRGVTAIRDAIEEALQQSGLLKAKSSEEAQHYIDSLLKAIVDVESQRIEDENSGETTSTPAEQTTSETEAAQETDGSRQDPDKNSITKGTQSTDDKSRGFFSKIMDSFRTAEPSTSSEPSTTAQTPVTEKPDTLEVAVEATTTNPVPQSSELVDLIVKMTSRAGISSDDADAVQEVSDDQAKLRKFETLLSQLVAADEPAEGEGEGISESEGTASSSKEDGASATPQQSGKNDTQKPVFGIVLTTRNKVNGKHVDRPVDLSPNDHWEIEYRMEEIPEDKVQGLYSALKQRRKKAFKKEENSNRFEKTFGGNLKVYSQKGKRFREEQDMLDASDRPLYAIGNPKAFNASAIDPHGTPLEIHTHAPPNVKSIQAARRQWDEKLREVERERTKKAAAASEAAAAAKADTTEVAHKDAKGKGKGEGEDEMPEILKHN